MFKSLCNGYKASMSPLRKTFIGDMASDLYGPQFWDDNFQFSFSVVVSCKSNKQLGYF